ncbi:transposase [Candidatus Contendibacter odensensis]|uniref:Transposase n=1 Tax=Candidatus Contendobacter odensis Run_B_J11 TaxID=1400861 RepID=A0A7U7G7F7_9GAMM
MAGQLVVFAEDECHLLSGDTLGCVWGRKNERTEVPIKNARDKQTYYGALNLYNKDFVLAPCKKGNGENTVLFIKKLRDLNPDKKLMIIWDGASYHRCQEVHDYLSEVNQDLDKKIGK